MPRRQRFLRNAGNSPRQRFQLVDRVQGKSAALGILLKALVLHDRGGVRNRDHRAIAARREQFVERRIPAAPSGPAGRVGAVGDFQQICGRTRHCCRRRPKPQSFRFFRSASDLIFLLPGLISSSTSCSSIASARARGGTLVSVRSTARSACLRSNSASALALSRTGDDLETQPRIGVLEHGRELGGKTGFHAVAIADGEDQRLGIPQPDAATPYGRDRQDHGQRDKQQHLPPVASHNPRTRGRLLRWRRWHFSAHGSYPPHGRFAA